VVIARTGLHAGAPDNGRGHAGVIGLQASYLGADHWVAQLPDPDRVILDRAGIAAQNARMRAEDKSIHDLAALPATLSRDELVARIQELSSSAQPHPV
jgi:hypothetical protein